MENKLYLNGKCFILIETPSLQMFMIEHFVPYEGFVSYPVSTVVKDKLEIIGYKYIPLTIGNKYYAFKQVKNELQ